MLVEKLAQDLKAAMLAGDTSRVDALKMLKTAITYKEVELGKRDTGLSDEEVIAVFSKEAKKRSDAAQMYQQAGRSEQAAAEQAELELINTYLPAQASDEDIQTTIDEVVAAIDAPSLQQMGQVIAGVKAKLGQTADGGRIAALVKQTLS